MTTICQASGIYTNSFMYICIKTMYICSLPWLLTSPHSFCPSLPHWTLVTKLGRPILPGQTHCPSTEGQSFRCWADSFHASHCQACILSTWAQPSSPFSLDWSYLTLSVNFEWLLSCVQLFATPKIVAHQAPLLMEFSTIILESGATTFSRGFSQLRDWNCASCLSCVGFFTTVLSLASA